LEPFFCEKQSEMMIVINPTIEPRINTFLDSPTRGLFLTCTQGVIFFYIGYTHVLSIKTYRACMNLSYEKKLLTWNVGSLYMAANNNSCWSLAKSQLPHLKPPPLP
jgi:hypothetical protein